MNFLKNIINSIKKDELYPIVFYGASTTSAEYSMPNWGEIMRYWLKEKVGEAIGDYKRSYWNIQTYNSGISGGSSEDIAERFEKRVLSLNPKIIFLSVGKNDPYYGIDKKITEKNAKQIIRKALDAKIKVVFTTAVPALSDKLNEKIEGYVELDRKIAKEFSNEENFLFVDIFKEFPKNELVKIYTLISVDGNKVVGIAPGEVDLIHYNKFGNALVAKILLKKVYGFDFDADRFIKDLADSTKKYPGLD